MPIYDQHYHPWGGVPTPRWRRWAVITRYHLRELFTGKGRNALIVLLAIAGVIHLFFLAVIYIWANQPILDAYHIPYQKLPPIDQKLFLYPIMAQAFTCAFLTLIVGSGLIADDRRDNAIPLYLSKPLTPVEYLLGKFGVVAFFTLAVTAVPVNLLYVFQVLIGGGWTFLKTYWWLPLSITSLSMAITLVCGSVILMASSLVKKGAFAGVMVVGLFVGHNIIAGVLGEMVGGRRLMAMSIQFDLHRLGIWLYRVASDDPEVRNYDFSGPTAALVIFLVVGVCWAILLWRVRPVEVVK